MLRDSDLAHFSCLVDIWIESLQLALQSCRPLLSTSGLCQEGDGPQTHLIHLVVLLEGTREIRAVESHNELREVLLEVVAAENRVGVKRQSLESCL